MYYFFVVHCCCCILFMISEWPRPRTGCITKSASKALSTCIRIFLKTQLFFYGVAFRPQVNDENGHQKRNFSKTLSKVELFENAVFLFSCGRKKVWKRNFSKTLTSHLRSQATLQREISNMVDNRVFFLVWVILTYFFCLFWCRRILF